MEYEEPVLWLILVDLEAGVKTEWILDFSAKMAMERLELRYPGRVIGYYDEDNNYIRTRIIND
jgi:hypothetical protein